jgi:uncharacterized protein (TIGR02453 family)
MNKISKTTFDFLSLLKENNNREWFLGNKKQYESAKKEVESFVAGLIPELAKLDPSIQSPDVNDCMFRIYKDVRFSKDKLPYKTNFGAFIGRGGRKTIYSGYYIHIEPGESMIAGGVYMPQPEVLKLLRKEVYYNSVEFKKIIESREFRKYFDKLGEFDKMKKAPREFPADFPDIDLLKYRSYIVTMMIPDIEVLQGDYGFKILEVAKAMLPLNEFLNRAIDNK